MKKRILSLLLSVCMLICMLPLAVSAYATNETAKSTAPSEPNEDGELKAGSVTTDSGDELLEEMIDQINSDSPPSSFSDDTLTPYGTEKDEVFTMLENMELFTYTSAAGSLRTATFEDNLDASSSPWESDATDLVNKSELGALRFARGVAFDPTGCGRRNYVAIVGYLHDSDSTTGSVYLFIINADSKKVEKKLTLRSGDMKLRSVMDSLTLVDSAGFFQITAGDYNDDGYDSVVVYTGCMSNAKQTGLFEVSYGGNSSWSSTQIAMENLRSTGYFFNSDFVTVNSEINIHNTWQARNQLNVSMTTGDVNNDGIDDLVVVSYAADLSDNYVSAYGEACNPELCIGYGTTGVSGVGKLSVVHKALSSMTAPGVSTGDIDGDGAEEIVVAGYYNEWSSSDPINITDGTIAYTYYKYVAGTYVDGTMKCISGTKTLSGDNISIISQGDSLREKEVNVQQFSVECVSFDGMNTKEYIFLNGVVYYLNNGEFVLINDHLMSNTDPIFQTLVTKINGTDIDEVFIYSTSTGNVLATTDGREALAVTIGFKSHTDANKEGKYFFTNMLLYNSNAYNGNINTSGLASRTSDYVYDSSHAKNDGTYMITVPELRGSDNKGASGTDGISCFMVMVDYDYDTVNAKYTGKSYTYTDPSVVAFLQAAPYYSEFDPGNSSTTYSYSESYESTSGVSSEISYNIGVSSEIEAPGVKTSLEAGLATGLTEEFTKSVEKTYTTTFEANGENQVIIRQTLMYYYYYDVYDYDKDTGTYGYRGNSIVISVPQYPVLYTLSMEQYNALANAYNNMVDKLKSDTEYADYSGYTVSRYMDVISEDNMEKYFLNNEGNPYGYASNISDYNGNGFDLYTDDSGSSSWIKLSHAGGTTSQSASVSLGEETSKTVSEGCYTNMTVMAGAEAFGVSAFLGASFEYERSVGESYSTARITTTETEGTVQNLDGDYKDYSFNWKLIGWKTAQSDKLFYGVPFVGYAVSNQSALPQPVDDLDATYPTENEGEALLTWTAPDVSDGRLQIDEFAVYSKKGNKLEPIGTVANTGTDDKRQFTVDISDYESASVTFVVKTVTHGAKDKYSIESNEAECFLSMTETQIKELVDKTRTELENKINDVKDAVENGQNEALKTAIAELSAAYAEADKLLENKLVQSYEEADKQLKEQLSNAVDTLQEAINQLQTNLENTANDINNAIEAGDAANAKALKEAIEQLTAAYEASKAMLKSDIDSNATAADKKLDNVEDTINKTISSSNEALNNANEVLRKAYTQADDEQKKEIEDLLNQLEDLTLETNSEFEELLGSLETVNEQMDEQEQITDESIRALIETVNAQQEELNTTRTIAIIGVCLASVSLLINFILIMLSLRKRRH